MINTASTAYVTIYYPMQVVFLKDFNSVVVEGIFDTENIKEMSCRLTVFYNKNNENLSRAFDVTVEYNTITFDLSYFFREIGSGVTMQSFLIEYTLYGKTNFVGLSQNIIADSYSVTTNAELRNGYSLPNRQHFSETSVYVPNQQVWDKYTNTTGETPHVDFSSNLPVIINGERYAPYETIPISSSDDDCKTVAEVDISGIYDAWKTCNNPSTYGISGIWANHVYIEEGTDLYNAIFNEEIQNDLKQNGFIYDSENPYTYHITREQDAKKVWTENEGNIVVGMILHPIVGRPYAYKLVACSYVGVKNNGSRDVVFESFITQNIIIKTDRYDDFLSLDYHTKNGMIQPTYMTTINDVGSGNVTFYIANEYFKSEDGYPANECSFLVRGIYFAVNTSFNYNDWGGDSIIESLLTLLGLRNYTEANTYDYTLVSTDKEKRFFLHGLSYGWSYTIGQIIGGVFDICFNSDLYACFSEQEILYYLYNEWDGLTPQIGSFKGRDDIDCYVPIYNLWWFWNAKDINSGGVQITYNSLTFKDFGGNPEWIEYVFPTKIYDNAIATPTFYKGISFFKAAIVFTTLTIDKLPLTLSPQSLYFFPNPYELGYWRSTDLILQDEGGLYYDVNGSMVQTAEEAGRVSVILKDPTMLISAKLDANDDGVVDLEFGAMETNRNWINITSLTFYSGDDANSPITYYHFPYNCSMPVALINNDTLFRYMGGLSMTAYAGCGGGGDKSYRMEVIKYYLNPFNVGRNTVIDGGSHSNPPEIYGWFSLTQEKDSLCEGTENYSVITGGDGAFNSYNALYAGLTNNDIQEMPFYRRYKNTDYQLMVTAPNIITSPCVDSGVVVHDFSKGAISKYNIILYSLCDTDQVFWLRYENMDGFERWLPFEIKRRVYENTMGDFKYVTPTQSSINAYPMQSPLSLQEKITCFIGDVPQDCYIEDILYSPYLEGWNWDGSVHFQCILEENEIVRDSSQELEDFVFNFIKKK